MTTMLTSYEDALARILASIEPLPIVNTPLGPTLGRVLAADITAPIDLPSFDNSAMDGYAVRAADTAAATSERPVSLDIIGEIAAGSAAERIIVGSGQAARVFTGGTIPAGADAVVPIEDTIPSRSDAERIVSVALPAAAGAYVRRAGSDIRRGELAIPAGSVIRPAEIALAASLGFHELPVRVCLNVAVIATGSELVDPGRGGLAPGQIYNSNAYALAAQVETAKGSPTQYRVGDDRTEIQTALDRAVDDGAHVIVTSGGVSVGDYDLVKSVVEAGGRGRIDFWRVAIRPGKPFVFGTYRGRLFFGLPGNPVSTMVTFELFVRPALRRLSGYDAAECARSVHEAVLDEPARHEPGRRSFQRAWTEFRGGRLAVRPVGGQASHVLSAMVAANSLLILPESVDELPAGATAQVMLLD